MINIRKSDDRGMADFGWLKSRHSFSFGRYFDPGHMGFGPLRVINEDRVAASQGFGTHPHDNMEIISIVLSGELEHKDNIGNGSVIRPGDVQRMSAGSGVTHSEFNPSDTDETHFLQIWIIPEKDNVQPNYAQKNFPDSHRQGQLQKIISGDGSDGSIQIHQDADLYRAQLNNGDKIEHTVGEGRIGWVQVIQGSLSVNGQKLDQGDGAAIQDESSVVLADGQKADILLFDMIR